LLQLIVVIVVVAVVAVVVVLSLFHQYFNILKSVIKSVVVVVVVVVLNSHPQASSGQNQSQTIVLEENGQSSPHGCLREQLPIQRVSSTPHSFHLLWQGAEDHTGW